MHEPSNHLPDDAIVTAAVLAVLGYGHPVTLCRKRKDGSGPPFVQLSPHRVGYRMRDVREWTVARTANTTAKASNDPVLPDAGMGCGESRNLEGEGKPRGGADADLRSVNPNIGRGRARTQRAA